MSGCEERLGAVVAIELVLGLSGGDLRLRLGLSVSAPGTDDFVRPFMLDGVRLGHQ